MNTEQTPTVGRIVNYNTTIEERKELGQNMSNESKTLPAIIVAVWGNLPTSPVNLKVMVDGHARDLWKTSLSVGELDADNNEKEGNWYWPVRK